MGVAIALLVASIAFAAPYAIDPTHNTGAFVVLYDTSGGSTAVSTWVSVLWAAAVLSPWSALWLKLSIGRIPLAAWLSMALSVPLLVGIAISEEQPRWWAAALVLILPAAGLALIGRLSASWMAPLLLALLAVHLLALGFVVPVARSCSSAEDCFRITIWTSLLGLGLYWLGCGLALRLPAVESAA